MRKAKSFFNTRVRSFRFYQETRFKPWIVKRLSSFYDSEDAFIYSGYDANVGFISAVAQR